MYCPKCWWRHLQDCYCLLILSTALHLTLDNVFNSIDKGKSTLLVSLDLSAVFDTIDHGILLSRLDTLFSTVIPRYLATVCPEPIFGERRGGEITELTKQRVPMNICINQHDVRRRSLLLYACSRRVV